MSESVEPAASSQIQRAFVTLTIFVIALIGFIGNLAVFIVRNTRILIGLAYAIPCFTSIYMHLAHNCLLPYVDFGWYFGVNTSADCDVIRFYVDFCKDFGVVAAIAVIDITTIIMIKVTAVETSQRQTSVALAESEKKRQREITFVKQCLIQGAVFATELVLFFIVSTRQTHPILIFLCTTVAWSMVHTIDPLVLILLNREFRNMLMKNPIRWSNNNSNNRVAASG